MLAQAHGMGPKAGKPLAGSKLVPHPQDRLQPGSAPALQHICRHGSSRSECWAHHLSVGSWPSLVLEHGGTACM